MHFHFDLTDGRNTTSDAEGVDAGDLSEAIEQAGTVIEELRRGGELMDVDGARELVIEDSCGHELHRIPILSGE